MVFSLKVQGQKNIPMYFNDWGFCGPGPIIQESISLFSDSSFEYYSGQYPQIKLEASGHFSKNEKYITLKYEKIKIDSLNMNKESTETINIKLISEFKISRDKEWLKNKAGMLIECDKHFRSKIRILEPRKRRVITTKTIDYKDINN
jgi:hypothetical protein